MAKATLNKIGIATKAGDMTVYNYDGETREFLSTSTEFLAVGVGFQPTRVLMRRSMRKKVLPFAARPALMGGIMLSTTGARPCMTPKPVSLSRLPGLVIILIM